MAKKASAVDIWCNVFKISCRFHIKSQLCCPEQKYNCAHVRLDLSTCISWCKISCTHILQVLHNPMLPEEELSHMDSMANHYLFSPSRIKLEHGICHVIKLSMCEKWRGIGGRGREGEREREREREMSVGD